MKTELDLLTPSACLCFNLRRAAKAVTRELDAVFAPLGLSAPQFSALAVLKGGGEMTTGTLAEALGADRTTVTRNIVVMTRDGLIEIKAGEDKRERRARLTRKGRAILTKAMPRWRKFQKGLVASAGAGDTAKLLSLLNHFD